MTSLKHFIKVIGSTVLFSTVAWGLLSCQAQSPSVSSTKDGQTQTAPGEQNQISGDIPLFDSYSELFNYLLIDCDETPGSIKKSKKATGYGKLLPPQLSQKSAYYNCLYWAAHGSLNAPQLCGDMTGCYAPPKDKVECRKQIEIMKNEINEESKDIASQGHTQKETQTTSSHKGKITFQGKDNGNESQDTMANTNPSLSTTPANLPGSIKPDDDDKGSSPAERACARMFPSTP